MRISSCAKWAEWEDDILRTSYKAEIKSAGLDECHKKLPHRSRAAIKDHARSLGISLPKYDVVKRFFRRLRITPGCWIWIGGVDEKGYGIYKYDGKKIGSHRASYIIHSGDFDRTLFVCHKCDNPICVNPDHLFLGTNQDNMNDMIKKGRQHKNLSFLKGCGKISDEQALEIFKSSIQQKILANKFNVSQSLISLIKSGKTRKHIHEVNNG